MLQTFFFIPANRNDFLKKSMSLNVDSLIIDFEESVSHSETESVIANFDREFIDEGAFARVSVVDSKTDTVDGVSLEKIIALGFRNIILPKISAVEHLTDIACLQGAEECKYCLLIENPLCLINLREILHSEKLSITHLALGSHDYANSMGMDHKIENLSFARNYVLNYARAYGLQAIDVASMDIHATCCFANECKDAVSLGFDGKFILHPKQLDALGEITYYSNEEIENAIKVHMQISKVPIDEMSVVEIDGVLYEKPHLNRIRKIVEWSKRYGRK